MHLRHVTITVPAPAETARFLAGIFGFPVAHGDEGETLTIGSSTLVLVEGPAEQNGYYHLAFDIPEHAVVEARDLLAARVPIFTAGDNGVTTGPPSWNSHSVYFNAPGNLNLELIGRHRLPIAMERPYSLSDVLHISEVGVPVENPLAVVQELRDQAGLEPFGEPSEMFAPVGDDHGLLIVVKHGRTWFPTTDQTTTQRPLRIQIDGFPGELVLGRSCTILGTGQEAALA